MEKKQRILIIDDEQINRAVLIKILSDKYDIIEAEDGVIGWELLLKNRDNIAAILLDVIMPNMDGYQFLDKIKETQILDIPVIVTTGVSDVESEQKILEAGAWDFISKPYNAKVMRSRLQNAIGRSREVALKKLQYMVDFDELTGLYSRSKMFAETRRLLDDNPDKRFIMIHMDVDHFALFNASFGEKEGNKLLKYLAECVQQIAERYPCCTYGRVNADRFCACVAYDGNRETLVREFEENHKKVESYRKDYQFKLSVGVCEIKDPSLSVEDLYFHAAVAARECKNQAGFHLSFYDEKTVQKMEKEVEITGEMQTALDEEQFVIYFQPKFTLSDEHICGSEALVRWIHPVRGLVMPGDFIPVCEKNGFISKLDYYVWEKTCQHIHEWIENGKIVFPVSVNISRISLCNPQLPTLLTELVEKYRIPNYLFQLEITESAYMTDPERMENTIEALHEAGFVILMDDFGSGYSSLNTLKRIKVDVLKVDMKFLPVMDETERGEIILASVIKMAKWLGMSVVVEGVETRRQRDFLEGAGCDSVQGYYYSRPIPQKEYEEKYLNETVTEQKKDYENTDTAAVPKHNVTVLVIEDSEIDRVILNENLQDLYHVHMCDNAEEGLAFLSKNSANVRLILVDNYMPGMSGLEFLQHCRQDSILKSIPKIMITAEDTVENQVKAFHEGAYDYITKPLVKEIVLARVQHIMDASRQTSIYDSVETDYKMQAERDAMTGLLSRSSFIDISTKVIEAFPDDTEALFVIDIDNCKELNESYGRKVGDEIIEIIAEILKNSFRKTDVMGRFSGDEFIVLMIKLPGWELAERKAAELLSLISRTCMKVRGIEVNVSIGISFLEKGANVDILLARADQALYEAKRTGKGRAVIYGGKFNEQRSVSQCRD